MNILTEPQHSVTLPQKASARFADYSYKMALIRKLEKIQKNLQYYDQILLETLKNVSKMFLFNFNCLGYNNLKLKIGKNGHFIK